MIRTLCTAAAVLAIGAGSAGVANASEVSPLPAAADKACDNARVAEGAALSAYQDADKAWRKAKSDAKDASSKVPADDPTKISKREQDHIDQLAGVRSRAENDLSKAKDRRQEKCGGGEGPGRVGGVHHGSHDWHGRWDRRFDHGRTIVLDGIVVDFGRYASLAAFRASDLYRFGSADFRGACDEALRIRSFELRHGHVVGGPLGHRNAPVVVLADCENDKIVQVRHRNEWKGVADRYSLTLREARSANSDGGHKVTRDEARRVRASWDDYNRHRSVWLTSVNRRRLDCHDNGGDVSVINVEQPPVEINYTVNQANVSSGNGSDSSSSDNGSADVNYSAPAPSGGQVSVVPKGSVDTGDGSTEV